MLVPREAPDVPSARRECTRNRRRRRRPAQMATSANVEHGEAHELQVDEVDHVARRRCGRTGCPAPPPTIIHRPARMPFADMHRGAAAATPPARRRSAPSRRRSTVPPPLNRLNATPVVARCGGSRPRRGAGRSARRRAADPPAPCTAALRRIRSSAAASTAIQSPLHPRLNRMNDLRKKIADSPGCLLTNEVAQQHDDQRAEHGEAQRKSQPPQRRRRAGCSRSCGGGC